jgi:hypothetical protein
VLQQAANKNLPKVVKLLAAKGAKIAIWNREDRFGGRRRDEIFSLCRATHTLACSLYR